MGRELTVRQIWHGVETGVREYCYAAYKGWPEIAAGGVYVVDVRAGVLAGEMAVWSGGLESG